ncbi:transcription factor Adf-1-like [Takifugu flavidus]|uniref:transcription factor Adf-1-like n=1 Tax=Takifugu flavidus TaxID=433684 RepID=UPI002544226A|nr:transcription factor Adf-1-like [Takifugu flavidus]
MDEEKLITEVKNHSMIYDNSHRFYKDNYKKEKAWKDIAEAMGVDADTCKAKWRTLRDSFVRQRKKVSASGSAGGPQKEWKFNDIMSFLVLHIQQRRTGKNHITVCSHKIREGVSAGEETPSPALSTCGSDEQASEMQPPPSLSSVPSPSQPTTAGERDRSHRSPRKREFPDQTTSVTRKRAGAPELEDRRPSTRQEPPSKPESELDECYHFALSLVPLLHRLDHNNRQHAKIGILNLLSVKPHVQLTNNWSCNPPPCTPATVPPPRQGTFRPNTHPPTNETIWPI